MIFPADNPMIPTAVATNVSTPFVLLHLRVVPRAVPVARTAAASRVHAVLQIPIVSPLATTAIPARSITVSSTGIRERVHM